MARVVIMGPAHPLRGGLATFNQRLAQEFINEGHSCEIISFSLQYPSLLFPGKTQFSNDPPPKGIRILSLINSVNPVNWFNTGKFLKKEKPDVIVVRFWIPFMGAALGTILRKVKKNCHTKIVCIADNIIPHEARPGDKALTKYFLKACDSFITMSEKVMEDLKQFQPNKPAMLVRHPLYDSFGEKMSKAEARKHLSLGESDKIILFFGFIRKYKGLDILLKALAEPGTDRNIRLLVAGEFYEDAQPYFDLVKQLQLEDRVIMQNKFIPDAEVSYYLSAADCVVQPYRNATQSGVTPLAYHFEKPMIVTNVGGLPDLVPDNKAGLVCEPDPASVAAAIRRFYQLGEDYFIPHLRNEKSKYSWSNLTRAVFDLADRHEHLIDV
jgi:glycosyltransferase involved in cell wall biosynthesis